MDLSLLGLSAIKELYNVHPMFVHFPAALLPASFLLYGLGIVFRKTELLVAGRNCLYLAAAGALAAVATGLLAEDSFPHNEKIHHMMQTHETLAWGVLGLSLCLGAWSFFQEGHRPKRAWAFLALLGGTNLVMMLGADLGARMVYVEGAAVKPAVAAITGRVETPGAEAGRPPAPAGHYGHKHTH